MKRPHCIAPWTWFAALPNGDVTPCCFNQDVMGNVHQQSVDKIWNSGGMKKLRVDMFKENLLKDVDSVSKLRILVGKVEETYTIKCWENILMM